MALLTEFSVIRSGIERVAGRGVDLPTNEVMLTRKLKHLGAAMTLHLQRLLQPHGLVEADFIALMQLFGSPGMSASPGELCGLTAQRPTNMTRIADALVRWCARDWQRARPTRATGAAWSCASPRAASVSRAPCCRN